MIGYGLIQLAVSSWNFYNISQLSELSKANNKSNEELSAQFDTIVKENNEQDQNSGILTKLGLSEADRMGVMMGQKQNLQLCLVLNIIAFFTILSMGWQMVSISRYTY